jgi:hypothetical protein
MERKRKNGYCIYIVLSLVFFYCSGSKETSGGKNNNETQSGDKLIDYEKSFDPAKYDLVYEDYSSKAKKNDLKSNKKANSKKIVSGFRIQTILSGEFEDCQRDRKEFQKQFPDQKTYIVHEFPFYKLRIGDFVNRKDAEIFLKFLNDNGIRNGLIVPDKITIE